MKWTNKLNLPEAIVNAVTNDDYNKGFSDISITGLTSPPRIRVLKKKHDAELEEDISDRMFVLLGQIMHGILERANTAGLAEKRFYLDIEGITISGQLDALYTDGLIQDYKLVSLYQVRDGVKPEYEQQQNMYAYLVRHGYVLDKRGNRVPWTSPVIQRLELVCILRDWSKSAANRDADIPQQQVVKLPVKMWSDEEQQAFLIDRIKIHKAANKTLPACTDEERWAQPDKWAVMPKKNAPRSLKNHLNKDDAEKHAADVKGFVEFRPGVNNRCEAYCPVSKFCTQFKDLKKLTRKGKTG